MKLGQQLEILDAEQTLQENVNSIKSAALSLLQDRF
jgi:hypothetical protein